MIGAMNIIEQEDFIKGLTDADLQGEVSNPSGQFYAFLPVSELDRRNKMREDYEAGQDASPTTVTENVLASSIGMQPPTGLQSPQMSMGAATPQLPAAPMPSGSPVPVNPISLPSSFPEGGYNQGLAGAGVQYVSTGGVVGMQGGGTAPEFYSGNPSDYPPQGLLSKTYDVLTPDLDLRFWKWAANKGIDLGKASGEAMFNLYKDYQLEVPYETMERYSKVSPELAYQTYTGRDPEEQSVWAEAREDYRAGMTPERYPFAHMDSQAKSQLPLGDYLMFGLREGGKRNLDWLGNFGPALGKRTYDLITSGIGGDPTVSPETQREEWRQGVEDVVTGGAEAVDQQRRDLAKLFVDDLMGSGERVLQDRQARQDAIEDMYATTGEQARPDEFPSRSGAFDLEMINRQGDDPLLDTDELRDLISYSPETEPDGWFQRSVENWLGTPEEFGENLDTFGNTLLNKEGTGVIDRFADWIRDGSAEPKDGTSNNAIKEDGEKADGDPVLASLLSQQAEQAGPLIDINPRYIDPRRSDFISTSVDGGGYPLTQELLDQRELLSGAQEDVATNLQDLITQTRQDAKSQAFYLGMAALGGGIAAGDISKGMQDAVQVAGATVARGEQAAAPLQAAMATQPAQAAKDTIEALTSIASVDAAYKTIAADIRRQGRLDRQSLRSLRSSAITAAQRAMQELNIYPDSPEEAGAAINQIVELLVGEVAMPYYGQTEPDMQFYVDNQQLLDRAAPDATGR